MVYYFKYFNESLIYDNKIFINYISMLCNKRKITISISEGDNIRLICDFIEKIIKHKNKMSITINLNLDVHLNEVLLWFEKLIYSKNIKLTLNVN